VVSINFKRWISKPTNRGYTGKFKITVVPSFVDYESQKVKRRRTSASAHPNRRTHQNTEAKAAARGADEDVAVLQRSFNNDDERHSPSEIQNASSYWDKNTRPGTRPGTHPPAEGTLAQAVVRGGSSVQTASDPGQNSIVTKPMQGGQNDPQSQPQQLLVLGSPVNGPAEFPAGAPSLHLSDVDV
jgi:hypothetical protein